MYIVEGKKFKEFYKAYEFAEQKAKKLWEGHVDIKDEDGRKVCRIKRWYSFGPLKEEVVWYR